MTTSHSGDNLGGAAVCQLLCRASTATTASAAMSARRLLCLGALLASVATLAVAQLATGDDNDGAPDYDDAYKDVETHSCECVPFYQCTEDGRINTNGGGIFDVKERLNGDIVYDVADEECPNDDENNPMKCCTIPREQTPPEENKGRLCGTKGGSEIIDDGGFERIKGGSGLSFGELPWMLVLMKVSDGDQEPKFKCGASLIHPQVALTAAHCVYKDRDVSHYIVRAGEYDMSGEVEGLPHQDLAVVEIAVPRNYNTGALYHDYALIQLEQPVVLADHIALICLPEKNENFDGQGCLASGWGKDAFAGHHSSVLRKVDLTVVASAACQMALRMSRLGRYFILDPSFVCAQGKDDADTCEGDGGSPLMCPLPSDPSRWTQVGITAWGIGCGSELPAVYANVAAGRGWIDQTLHGWGFDLSDEPGAVADLDDTINNVFNGEE